MQQLINYVSLLAAIVLCHGCISHQELVNFNEGEAFPTSPTDIVGIPEIRIQSDDILDIQVHLQYELTPEDKLPFNNASGSGASGTSAATPGYVVDKNGTSDLPIIGSVQVAGLTTTEAKAKIVQQLEQYYKNPVVNVRFMNFKFTIFGEVGAPGTYTFPEERISILEAIGTAGDLLVYADRKDIQIIREQDGKRQIGYINLRSRQLFDSPYFYLRPNDVIYVRPIKQKIGTVSDQFTKTLPWISVGVTLLNLIAILTRT